MSDAICQTPARSLTDPENTVYMDLKDGRVVIQMLPDIAPKHVARVKQLIHARGSMTARRSIA